jgi:hypothetical protein
MHGSGCRRALALVALASLTGLGARAAHAGEAEEIRALRAEVAQDREAVAREREALAREREALSEQRRRVDDALLRIEDDEASEARLAALASAGGPAVGAAPGDYSGPRLEIYGFAMLDAIYDFDRMDPDWNDALRPSRIPVNCPGDAGCGEDGETVFSVRQSRLGFKGFLPTRLGELRTIFEFELYGTGDNAGDTIFRLRHAWGELGQFGAGQTWSLFMDPDVFPNTIEYWGPPGMVFFRNMQIRWSPDLFEDERWHVKVALESPGNAFDEGKSLEEDPNLVVNSWNSYPDFTSQLRFQDEWGHVQASAILRGLGVQATNDSGEDFRSRDFGWGINLASVLNLGWLFPALEGDQILAQVVYGHGIASYMNDGGSDVGPDHDPPGADAETIPTLGWLLYYNRTWNERWTSSIGYSEHRQWNTGGQSDSAYETGQYFNVNALYHPIPEMLVGPELIWGRRENKDGESGTDTRIQISFKYNFSGTIYGGDR